ncbi:alpha/beta hydrolase fold domain-containing protein [Nesterenkonia suensis]
MTHPHEERERQQEETLLAREAAPGERIAYGEHPEQHLELFGEAETARRAVILIHGGYFRHSIDLTHARPLAVALAEAGAAVALVEYRRTGGGGGHPRTLQDIMDAVAHCVDHWPGWGLRPGLDEAPVIAGHSAGGCLALTWASHRGADLPQARVRALAPITDLVREARLGLADGAVRDYMDTDPAQAPEAYRWEDPRSRVGLLSPGCEVQILHGTADATVDVEFSRDVPLPLTELDGAGHFDLIDPESVWFPTVRDALVD